MSIHRTNQLSLFSLCLDNCSTDNNITWNVYQTSSFSNSSLNITHWILFNQTEPWFFSRSSSLSRWSEIDEISGSATKNFTVTSDLFLANPQIDWWRFEVVYSSWSERSSVQFMINRPPRNGSCSISPLNGTTLTPFLLSCLHWFDEDQIQDYSLFSLFLFHLSVSLPPGQQIPRNAFSAISTFTVHLPPTDDPTASLQLAVFISPLDTSNLSALQEFDEEFNRHARPPISSANIIQLQGKSLLQLTQSTDQLSRTLLVCLSADRKRKRSVLDLSSLEQRLGSVGEIERGVDFTRTSNHSRRIATISLSLCFSQRPPIFSPFVFFLRLQL